MSDAHLIEDNVDVQQSKSDVVLEICDSIGLYMNIEETKTIIRSPNAKDEGNKKK